MSENTDQLNQRLEREFNEAVAEGQGFFGGEPPKISEPPQPVARPYDLTQPLTPDLEERARQLMQQDASAPESPSVPTLEPVRAAELGKPEIPEEEEFASDRFDDRRPESVTLSTGEEQPLERKFEPEIEQAVGEISDLSSRAEAEAKKIAGEVLKYSSPEVRDRETTGSRSVYEQADLWSNYLQNQEQIEFVESQLREQATVLYDQLSVLEDSGKSSKPLQHEYQKKLDAYNAYVVRNIPPVMRGRQSTVVGESELCQDFRKKEAEWARLAQANREKAQQEEAQAAIPEAAQKEIADLKAQLAQLQENTRRASENIQKETEMVREAQRLFQEQIQKTRDAEARAQAAEETAARLRDEAMRLDADRVAAETEAEQLRTPPPVMEEPAVVAESQPEEHWSRRGVLGWVSSIGDRVIGTGKYVRENWSLFAAMGAGAGARFAMAELLKIDMATADNIMRGVTALSMGAGYGIHLGVPLLERLPVVGERIQRVEERAPQTLRRIGNIVEQTVDHVFLAGMGWTAESVGTEFMRGFNNAMQAKPEPPASPSSVNSEPSRNPPPPPPGAGAENLPGQPQAGELLKNFPVDHVVKPGESLWSLGRDQLTPAMNQLGISPEGQTVVIDAFKDQTLSQAQMPNGFLRPGQGVHFGATEFQAVADELRRSVLSAADVEKVNQLIDQLAKVIKKS